LADSASGPIGSPQDDELWQRRIRRQNFLGYYDRELSYLRRLGADFGENHKGVASRLRLDPDHCDDPHVERLLEGFAFLAARIHARIDDEFPEIAGALLEELYPNFIRPVPSVSLVEFQTDPERGRQTTNRSIPRGTILESNRISRETSPQSRPMEEFVCRFRTCFNTELWPLAIESATWRPGSSLPPAMISEQSTAAVLELRIACTPDVCFGDLKNLGSLRFYLNGGRDVVYPLYELLLSRCHTILLRDASDSGQSKAGAETHDVRLRLSPAGFDSEDSLCRDAGSRRSFAGYQLLEDYFAFPEKFHFVDLLGMEALAKLGGAREASLFFLISPFDRAEWRNVLEHGVSARTFRLNCSPIVNLFSIASAPIQVRENVFELPVPVASRMEVYSIDSVHGQTRPAAERVSYQRYIDCGREEGMEGTAGYWNAVRRPSRFLENSSEMFLSLFERNGGRPALQVNSLTAGLTCTDRDWPFHLPMNQSHGDFFVNDHPEIRKIVCLRQPSRGGPAPSTETSLWRLLSQLSLNHLSLVEEGRNALQCLLRVHNLAGRDFGDENIDGISAVKSRPHFARVMSEHGMAFVRGKFVEIALDERRFTSTGAFLFGNIIERFLALYTSLNSFSQLSLTSSMRGDRVIHTWPPRSGAKIVI